MIKYGGQFLEPTAFINDVYEIQNFQSIDFWNAESKNWGGIQYQIDHVSIFFKSDNSKVKIESPIYISVDGIICCKMVGEFNTEDEYVRCMVTHLNSFLATLNFGGIYFSPITEQQLTKVIFDENQNTITISGNAGGLYYYPDVRKILWRHKVPTFLDSGYIDPEFALSRIIKSYELKSAYEKGNKLVSALKFGNNEHIIAHEVFTNYGLNKWINTLILGWTFLEILLDKMWFQLVIPEIKQSEISRKERLIDVKSYSAAIRTEFLYVNNFIDEKHYNRLNRLRKLRNDFAHKGVPAQKTDVDYLFETATYLIGKLTPVEFHFYNPGWARTGGWID